MDAAARGPLGLDAALNQVRYRDDPRAEAPGVALITRSPSVRRPGRRGHRWSVEEAARAADTLLGAIAGYCLARDLWDSAAEPALTAAVPDLSNPLRVLATARAGLTGAFDDLAAARRLTVPVLTAARQSVALVGDRFRAVPPERPMPWMDLRVTAAQRVRALNAVVDAYDESVVRWHGFVFAGPPPAARTECVADLRAALPVGAELARCEHLRERCRELHAAGLVPRPAARTLVRDLRTAVTALERAVFHASAG